MYTVHNAYNLIPSYVGGVNSNWLSSNDDGG